MIRDRQMPAGTAALARTAVYRLHGDLLQHNRSINVY